MKICMASQSFHPYIGGVSNYLIELGRGLLKRGHSVWEAHLRAPQDSATDRIRGIEVLRIPQDGRRLTPKFLRGYTRFKETFLKAILRQEASKEREIDQIPGFKEFRRFNRLMANSIKRISKEEDIDLIHLHDFQVLFVGKYLRDIKKPVILTWHVPFFKGISSLWKKFILSHLRNYDKVIFSTKRFSRNALDGGLLGKKQKVISPFVNTSFFKPEDGHSFRKEYGFRKKDKLLSCVARISPIKGQEFLIRAMPRILREVPQTKLLLVGNGSMTGEVLKGREGTKKRLYRLIEDLGLQKRVVFLGSLSRDEIPQVYQASDIVCLCSRAEGFGLSITEAMACETPVIGSNIGGISAQIEDGKQGFLVEPGNIGELAQKTTRLLRNEDLRCKMGQAARNRAQRYFSRERGVRQYLNLYHEVLNN